MKDNPMMKKNPNEYQIKVNGRFIRVSEARREDLEQELMNALDLIKTIEDKLDPLAKMVGNYISGE